MDVYWLEQTEADVPAEDQWLGVQEKQCLSGMRFAKRRADWQLGRWTAKRTLAAHLNLPSDLPSLANVEIRAAASGAPEAFLFNQPASVTISLSHSTGTAMCVVAPAGVNLGCDLEFIEPRSDAFVADYFTANEQALIGQASATERPRLVNLIWSAKESALKALREGLRLDTNCMDVRPVDLLTSDPEDSLPNPAPLPLLTSAPNGWRPLRVSFRKRTVFSGWWREERQLIRSVVLECRNG